MRALVAEENVINRAALRTVLERRGFVVDEVLAPLEESALQALTVQPDLAILSAYPTLADFTLACDVLRASNPDVYIAALLEADRAEDADGFLEAGADDYLVSSPFIQKLDERLDAICGQLFDDPLLPLSGDGSAVGVPVEAQGPRRAADPSVFDYAPVPSVLDHVTRHLGLRRLSSIPFEDAGGLTALWGWFPVLVQRGFGARWVNLQFEFDLASAERLYRASMRRSASSLAEMKAFLYRFHSLIRDELDARRDGEAFTLHFPARPIVVAGGTSVSGPIGIRARTERRGYRIDDNASVRLTASLERSRTIERPITQLRPYDILAAPIEAGGDRTLLREGIMLDDAYIAKIHSYAYLTDIQPRVHVFRPPGDTALFLSRR
ncbi:MAG TPA: response regulator [Rhodothermales bacterium]